MSERSPSPAPQEQEPQEPKLNALQETTLRKLCHNYGVPFNEHDYWVRPPDYFDLPNYATGYIGGDEYAGKTIYVGVDPEGWASS